MKAKAKQTSATLPRAKHGAFDDDDRSPSLNIGSSSGLLLVTLNPKPHPISGCQGSQQRHARLSGRMGMGTCGGADAGVGEGEGGGAVRVGTRGPRAGGVRDEGVRGTNLGSAGIETRTGTETGGATTTSVAATGVPPVHSTHTAIATTLTTGTDGGGGSTTLNPQIRTLDLTSSSLNPKPSVLHPIWSRSLSLIHHES